VAPKLLFDQYARSYHDFEIEKYPRNPRIEALSESPLKNLFAQDVIIDLPFGFPLNSILSLSRLK